MSKYTTEVRYICEVAAGLKKSEGGERVNDIIAKALPKVFDFDFPIFDEGYRSVLETKILRHYYTREIAFETVGLWKLKLETRLNEIMPFYNKLYETETYEFNPLWDVDVTTTRNETGNENSNNTTTTSGENKGTSSGNTKDKSIRTDNLKTETKSTNENTNTNAFSDTPQNGIEGVEQLKFLTDYRRIQDNGGGESTVSNTGTSGTEGSSENSGQSTNTFTSSGSDAGTRHNEVEWIERVTGTRNGDYVKKVREYREALLNIDMSIINDLYDLFFQLY